MMPTGQEEEGEDQGIDHTSDSDSRRSYGEVWAHSGDGSSGKGQCCTMDCEACGGLVGLVGQSNSHPEV